MRSIGDLIRGNLRLDFIHLCKPDPRTLESGQNGQPIICDNLRKSAVKYLYFSRSPVVSGLAFAAYC